MGAMKVWDGSAWQVVAPFSQRASVYVGPDQPAAGSTFAGDLWWDTDDPAPTMPGQELSYTQITSNVTISATTAPTANLVVDSGVRTYDGSPIMIEAFTGALTAPNASAAAYFTLWDGATDLGYIGIEYPTSGQAFDHFMARRLTPSAGSHQYQLRSFVSTGSGLVSADVAGAGKWCPTFLRITRV